MNQLTAFVSAKHNELHEKYHYSAAVLSGDLLFVSGQVGNREDGTPAPVFENQVRLAFAHLAEVLWAAGCTFNDIVDVTTFHTDPENQFDSVMKVRATIIGPPPYPNWTAIGVTWLAGFDFEIKVTARVPERAGLGSRIVALN